jgi:hypothetical protein
MAREIKAGLAIFFLFTGLRLAPAVEQAPDERWQQIMGEALNAKEKGDLAGAERSYRAGLELAEKFGPDDPRLAGDLNNLAITCTARADYADSDLRRVGRRCWPPGR